MKQKHHQLLHSRSIVILLEFKLGAVRERHLTSTRVKMSHLNNTVSQNFKVSLSHQGFTFHVMSVFAEVL